MAFPCDGLSMAFVSNETRRRAITPRISCLCSRRYTQHILVCIPEQQSNEFRGREGDPAGGKQHSLAHLQASLAYALITKHWTGILANFGS